MFQKGGKKLNNGPPKSRYYSLRQKSLSLVELHELFIKFKFHGAGNSKTSIHNYRKNFKLLLLFKPHLKLTDLQESTMIDFFEFLNTRLRKVGKEKIVRQYKKSSLALVRSNLNVFFNWLLIRQYIKTNPFEKIPSPEVEYTDRRAFSSKEFEIISFVVNTKIQWANLLIKKRNIAIIMMLVFTGLRKEELLELKLSDIDMDGRFVLVRAETSKSKRTRIIPMNSLLVPYLQDYLHYREDHTSNWLWVSGTLDRNFTEHGVRHLILLLTKVSKINCHLHRFRHTFATNYYKQTRDLVGLNRLMGHRSLKMTLSYLRSLPDDYLVEQMRKMTIDEFI